VWLSRVSILRASFMILAIRGILLQLLFTPGTNLQSEQATPLWEAFV
jgi:hypothetical protein